LPANSLPPEDPIMKAWEYGMVAYFLEIPNSENSFFQSLTKFQKCMFKRIHQVFISSDSPIKFPYNRSVDVEVHCAVLLSMKMERTNQPIILFDELI